MKDLRKSILVMAVLAGCLVAGKGLADQMGSDYPHNRDTNTGCAACHYIVSANPPAWVSSATPYDSLCESCHNDTVLPNLSVATHSSATTTNRYGSWAIECRTCHWPHHQRQYRTYSAASYVFSGTSTGLTATSLTMTGAGWSNDQFNGYVLVPNTVQTSYNYLITDTTSDTLTVSPNIDLTKAASGNGFAIFYGQLVSDQISTPNSGTRSVRFFNQTGANSFADGDATYDGVCEVCHTQVTHFRNDGSGSDQLHTNVNGGQAGANCITCHPHDNGFAHGSGGGAGSGCGTAASCHGLQDSHPTHLTNSDMVQVADCDGCHNTSNFPQFSDGQNLAATTVCAACHGGGVANAKQYWEPGGSETMTAGSWLVVAGDASYCGSCHSGNTESDHNRLNSVAACNDCHGPLVTKTDMIAKHNSSACSICSGSSQMRP